jgi:hypothetical protein
VLWVRCLRGGKCGVDSEPSQVSGLCLQQVRGDLLKAASILGVGP